MLETQIARRVRPESDSRRVAREFRGVLERGVHVAVSGRAPFKLGICHVPRWAQAVGEDFRHLVLQKVAGQLPRRGGIFFEEGQ